MIRNQFQSRYYSCRSWQLEFLYTPLNKHAWRTLFFPFLSFPFCCFIIVILYYFELPPSEKLSCVPIGGKRQQSAPLVHEECGDCRLITSQLSGTSPRPNLSRFLRPASTTTDWVSNSPV